MRRNECKFCHSLLKDIFADLGKSPLANSYLKLDDLQHPEPIYPLRAFVCNYCFMVQSEEFKNPVTIFSDYAYFSSYSDTWLKHAQDYSNMIISRFSLDEHSQIIEIASNDGYLLQYFKQKNIPILGIEPAENIAKIAMEKKIPTIIKFFDVNIANELAKEGKQADLLIGNNVLAHVSDINDFVEGLRILLKPEGIITIEFPHLLQLIKQNQFDTIYHEHASYLSLFTVQKIFSSHNLTIFDVDELSTHGGSLRIYAKHAKNDVVISKSVDTILRKEKKFGLLNISTYTKFQKQVDRVKDDLCNFLLTERKNGKKIVGYGAPAKGNTLLNYCGISSGIIEYTVDRSPHKQGLYLPGTHIPIMIPDRIRETRPDYLLILPWNIKDEVMTQMSYIRNWGGKFIVPIPELKIYS